MYIFKLFRLEVPVGVFFKSLAEFGVTASFVILATEKSKLSDVVYGCKRFGSHSIEKRSFYGFIETSMVADLEKKKKCISKMSRDENQSIAPF
jgi:hypothetical protein